MLMTKSIVINFQNDLRLLDNPKVLKAIKSGLPIIPVYVHDDTLKWSLGAASKLWLYYTLRDLDKSLRKLGSRLIVQKGTIGKNTQFPSLIFNPATIKNKQGGIFKVFTAYYKYLMTFIDDYLQESNLLQLYDSSMLSQFNTDIDLSSIDSLTIDDLDLLGPETKWNRDWQAKMLKHFDISEATAIKIAKEFSNSKARDYNNLRDRPDLEGTSKLAPYLRFGQISPYRLWQEAKRHEPYLRQLIWREFAYYTLYHFPDSANSNLKKDFDKFPWINIKDSESQTLLKRWQNGLTGYPIVDAGMRELWETGWMHNRVRMIVGSFLVKDLLIHWSEGAKWFWETLFDADLANNSMGWQWIAGSGVDASPFFRIFNPITQGEKFDPNGDYVRKWIPELSNLPNAWIHKPFIAPPLILADAEIELGKTYPKPIVNHDFARKRVLEIFKRIKKTDPNILDQSLRA